MRLTVIILVLLSTGFGVSQTTENSPESSSIQSGAVIDGSAHPEKIRDVDAYRLFFAVAAQPANATQTEKSRQLALLRNMRLQRADSDRVISILVDFSDKYDALIKNYNDFATAAETSNTDAEIRSFRKARDLLVLSTRAKLQATLSFQGMVLLDSFVQKEKKHMKVAVEDAE